jgi:hypothetical protein
MYHVIDFHATVIALLDSSVALHPIDIPAHLLPARADDVFLSFVHGRQLVGLKGSLTWRDAGGGLRFEIQDGVHVRRSRYTRIDAELAVTLTRGEETRAGTTVNVAPEGLLVKSAMAVELGEQLDVTLALPNQALKLRAKVVRHAGGMIALQLAGDRVARATVAEFVVERRAAELQNAPQA